MTLFVAVMSCIVVATAAPGERWIFLALAAAAIAFCGQADGLWTISG